MCDFTIEDQLGCLSRGLDFSPGEHGFPEVANIVKSNPELHVALEALPGLPGSGMSSIYLHERAARREARRARAAEEGGLR